MSMNIKFLATREVTFKGKDGKPRHSTQSEYFREWQTPTEVTYKIEASDNPEQAYKEYILNHYSEDELLEVYADDDIFEEGEPVSTVIYNSGKEHIKEFDDWLRSMDDNGYTVSVEVH